MGENKALRTFLGKPLVARVVDRVSFLGEETIVISNPPETVTFLGLPVYADLQPGRGALGGLYTALSVASQPLVAVVACDMPFANAMLLAALRDQVLEGGYDLAVPESAAGLEPMHAVYRRDTCLPAVQSALEAGEQRMISFYPRVKPRIFTIEEVRPFDPEGLAFINVNTPEEFHRAEELSPENRQDI
jgi:molybdopterin-guanine dinucleotide biosynthesis protein A